MCPHLFRRQRGLHRQLIAVFFLILFEYFVDAAPALLPASTEPLNLNTGLKEKGHKLFCQALSTLVSPSRNSIRPAQLVASFNKRSILTKIPPWVKWSMQKSPGTATVNRKSPNGYEFENDRIIRNANGISARETAAYPSAGSITTTQSGSVPGGSSKRKNVVCFFNPVSCFGRRASTGSKM
ncbi:hypothetical protein BV898_00175 [Hypsibius exemplaris]|uniref:Uncharacterized protein n=1 Tax=Hypsibius exemplaris TaxID=2072580 RepID=A0A1W0XF37_HYPEX|nr:hypothetical protein BV898_00175 [Hypsibius exemplaris]